jgi:hypothetical protein
MQTRPLRDEERIAAIFKILHLSVYYLLTLTVKVKFLCFNWASRHEGVLGNWKYSSTHSLTSALDESGQFHAPAALPPGKEPLAPTG